MAVLPCESMRYFPNVSSSPLRRGTAYFALFTVGVVAFEAVSYLSIRDYPLVLLPRLIILVAPPIIGGMLISERHLLSRVVSASALFMLAAVALSFHQFPAYLLPLALIICSLGAQNFLHQKPKTTLKTVIYSAIAAAITLLFVGLFIISMAILNRYLVNLHTYL